MEINTKRWSLFGGVTMKSKILDMLQKREREFV